jgi:hypothetical protein
MYPTDFSTRTSPPPRFIPRPGVSLIQRGYFG